MNLTWVDVEHRQSGVLLHRRLRRVRGFGLLAAGDWFGWLSSGFASGRLSRLSFFLLILPRFIFFFLFLLGWRSLFNTSGGRCGSRARCKGRIRLLSFLKCRFKQACV
jgi:hypothetical protein